MSRNSFFRILKCGLLNICRLMVSVLVFVPLFSLTCAFLHNVPLSLIRNLRTRRGLYYRMCDQIWSNLVNNLTILLKFWQMFNKTKKYKKIGLQWKTMLWFVNRMWYLFRKQMEFREIRTIWWNDAKDSGSVSRYLQNPRWSEQYIQG